MQAGHDQRRMATTHACACSSLSGRPFCQPPKAHQAACCFKSDSAAQGDWSLCAGVAPWPMPGLRSCLVRVTHSQSWNHPWSMHAHRPGPPPHSLLSCIGSSRCTPCMHNVLETFRFNDASARGHITGKAGVRIARHDLLPAARAPPLPSATLHSTAPISCTR